MRRLLFTVSCLALGQAASAELACEGCECFMPGDAQMLCNESTRMDDIVIAVGTLQRYPSFYSGAITSINAQSLQDQNFSSVADQLRAVPGVAISRSGNSGNLTVLRLRGAEANHTKVLLNGIDISDPATGEYDFGGLSMDGVSQIDVLRGESSSLYGSDAIGGTVNITTRGPRLTRSFRSRVEAGAQDSLRGSFGAMIPIGDGVQIWGDASSSAGFDVSPGGDEADGYSRRSLSVATAQWIGNVLIDGQITGTHLTNAFDSDSDFDGRLDDTPDALTTQRLFGYGRVSFDGLGWEHRASLSGIRSDAENPFAAFQNDTTGKRIQGQWIASRELGEADLALLGEIKEERFTVFGGEGAAQNQSQSVTSHAFAAEYIRNFDTLTLTLSGRWDGHETFADAWNGRAAARYDLPDYGRFDHSLRGSIATGTKNPTLTEQFGFFPGSFIGNPGLSPEQSVGVNLGYFGEWESLEFSVDLFRSVLRDEIVTRFNPDFTATVDNLSSKSTREGVEIAGYWSAPSNTLTLNGHLTLLRSDQDGAPEIRRPETLASLSATWRPTQRLTLNATAHHTGAQIDTDFSTFSNVELPSYSLLSGNARYKIGEHFAIYVRGENLLDEDYRDVVGYNSQGRTVFVGLESNF